MTGSPSTPLFVFELANNHMGHVEHGLRVIREFGALIREFTGANGIEAPGFRFAFKLQYRDLETFIHPDYQTRSDIKYVKRFQETRLSEADFRQLIAEMRACGFIPMCTPFDEASVGKIEAQGIEIIKIASCSFNDWPLLERIAASDKPIIASTAGALLEDIDRVVSFFEHRQRPLTLMHCVGEYPTPHEHYNLNQIDVLHQRYPSVPVGYSTHENPDESIAIKMAIAKGAVVFEKHVGVPTPEWPLNPYSASPEQVRLWLRAAQEAFAMCGPQEGRVTAGPNELDSLNALRRGVYAKRPIPAGKVIDSNDIFFAFPPQENQLLANDWAKYSQYIAQHDIPANGPVVRQATETRHLREHVQTTVDKVKALFRKGHIVVPGKSELEISHHYGMNRFDHFGLVMITVINREYCKKLLVMLPGQTHPEQYHLKKEETFLVLHGEVEFTLDDQTETYHSGDVVTVGRGVRHKFHTKTGVVFEELSSSHYPDDSYYTDASIMSNTNRKTLLTYWM
jgi:sialic acid synthase SpsE/quercetin dioxygenase-like cupin family protein